MAELGRTVVFEPAEHTPPREVKLLAEVATGVLDRFEEPLALAAVQDYFRQLYWTRGTAAFDKATLDGAPFPILREIADASPGTVAVPPKARAYWLGVQALQAVHPAMGDALLAFSDDALYDAKTGIRLDDPTHRSAGSNIFGDL